MKYVIVIDTDKKAVTAYPERPHFLRTGSESGAELAHRREVRQCYEKATCPDRLWDGVKDSPKNL